MNENANQQNKGHGHAHHVDEAKEPDGTVNQIVTATHTLEAVVRMLKGELVILKSSQSPVEGHPRQVDFHFRAEVKA